jgi:ribosome recycling factor
MGPSNQIYYKDLDNNLKLIGALCILDKTNILMTSINKLINKNECYEILAKIEALDLGIIPSIDTKEIKTYLDSVTYEERIKLKRKFRKLQRRYRKKHAIDKNSIEYGEKDSVPNSLQKAARKRLVFNSITCKVME